MMTLWRVGWAPVAVIAFHAALAAVNGHRIEFDPVFHFLGGAAGAYSVLKAMALVPHRLSARVAGNRGSVAVVAVALVAVLWECGEFAADLVFGSRVQAGWEDTSMDLILGVGGAALGVLPELTMRRLSMTGTDVVPMSNSFRNELSEPYSG